MKFLKRTQLATIPWSGGTSTQLFIYPQGTEYAKRDFTFRISTASVEAEESVFTSLPGVRRKLMVLDGSLHIKHKDQYQKQLHKFDSDEFSGDWETSAKGRVRDFNLMLRERAQGSIEPIILKKGEEINLTGSPFTFIYVYKGEINTGAEKAEEGDLVVYEGVNDIHASSLKNAELIITKVSL